MNKDNIPALIQKFYHRALAGKSVSPSECLSEIEEEYPPLVRERLKEEAELYLWCLEEALKHVNPKMWKDSRWVYFTPENKQHITTEEVYKWFQSLAEKYYNNE